MGKWLLAILVSGGFMADGLQAAEQTYHYVITETSTLTSLDPLDADNTNNLPVARMIYATPLETTEQSQLTSTVLESFKYDRPSKTIHWTVKENLKFDDGTPLTAEDVAFAVARMGYSRPRFPIIEHISGLKAWATSQQALATLPSGIEIKGREIQIKLDHDVEHPFFRFCLELFSIIPKKCVDPVSNKISCKTIPASGPYRIEERISDSIVFKKRNATEGSMASPARIRFDYVPAEKLPERLSSLNPLSVVAGNEIMFSRSGMQALSTNLTMKTTPASRFSTLLLNPNVTAFKDKKCRQYFAQAFRETYSEQEDKSQALEASIFTKILPGYLSANELATKSESPLSKSDMDRCRDFFKSANLTWGYARGEKSVFADTVEMTLKKISASPAKPVIVENRSELANLFASGKIAILNGGSGFWALDPAGDLKMLFTPNLHKTLQFVANKKELQDMISRLEKDPSQYTKINQYLYDEALFNVYAHVGRFFASPKKELLTEIPFAITSPAPWQVFRL